MAVGFLSRHSLSAGGPEAIAANAAYKTPAITSFLFNKEIISASPYTRPRTKDFQKLVTRHIWQTHVEEADHLRHHQDVKPIYMKRKETIERVFADAKEKHGMRWTTLR